MMRIRNFKIYCSVALLLSLTSCKKITQQPSYRQKIKEATISEIPLPLLNSDLIDVSLGQDASIIETQSFFSIKYLENFFITALDHRGWEFVSAWVTDKHHIFLLFERLNHFLIIELHASENDQLSRIRFFRRLASTS
jgi:hypothetical protein